MPTKKNQALATDDANASSSSTKNQVATPVLKVATIKGFNFTKNFVRLYFTSKDTAVLGEKSADNIRVANELKGLNVEYRIVGTVTTEFGTYNRVTIDCIS